MFRALWLVVAHELLEYRRTDDVTRNLVSLFVQHSARLYLRDYFRLSKWKTLEKFSRSCLQLRKTEEPRLKEFLANWKCLNWNWNLPSRVIVTKKLAILKLFSQLFCFEQVKTSKNLNKKLNGEIVYKKEIEQKKQQRRKVAFVA